jgi:hypothetical protein
MIYTNDEADKFERRKNFYFRVYLLPALSAGILIALAYLAYASGHLSKGDFIYGCVLSLTPAMFIYAFNRRHWLKMPDGTYHNIKGIPPTNKITFSEPAIYEAEYFYSKKEKITTLLIGLFLTGISVWISQKGGKSILIPIGSALAGLFLSYVGIKGLLDKTAKLKIAKNGLWTKKLGFVNWDDINYADVVEDKSGREPQLYLEIRLKGTKFEEADQPDERLLLSDLQNKGDIDMVINQSIINYNNQKETAAGNTSFMQ